MPLKRFKTYNLIKRKNKDKYENFGLFRGHNAVETQMNLASYQTCLRHCATQVKSQYTIFQSK